MDYGISGERAAIRDGLSTVKAAFRDLGMVVLNRDLPEHRLMMGDVGTIVHSYAADEAYEVEFVRGDGDTVAVVTVERVYLRSLTDAEILHVRQMD